MVFVASLFKCFFLSFCFLDFLGNRFRGLNLFEGGKVVASTCGRYDADVYVRVGAMMLMCI